MKNYLLMAVIEECHNYLEERTLTDSEKKSKEAYLKRFKKKDRFKDGKKLNSLAYAIATNHAKRGLHPPPRKKS